MKNKRSLFTRRALSNIIVVCIGILLYLGLSNFSSVAGAVEGFFSIISPFIIGIAIAYILNLPTRFFERRVFPQFKHKRGLSILLSYLLAILVLALLLGLILPQLVESIRTLLQNLPSYIDNLNNLVHTVGGALDLDEETVNTFLLSYNGLLTQITAWVRGILPNLIPNLIDMASQIGSGLVGALTAVIASIYMLAGRDKLTRQCRRVLYAVLPKRRADEWMRVSRLSNGVFSRFISGKILDSVIIGVICFIFMSIMSVLSALLNVPGINMPFAPLISVVIGVTNIIPFFGPFLGAIPSIMILLMINPWNAVWFTAFVIVLQQFDGNFLGPKILGDSTGLPALWVLVAIIVGGGLFGFAGMILGVPAAAVLYTLFSTVVENRLKRRRLHLKEELVRPDAAPNPDEAGNAPPEEEPSAEARPDEGPLPDEPLPEDDEG